MSRSSLVSTLSFAREDLRNVFSQHQTQHNSRVDSGYTATSIQQNCTERDSVSLVLSVQQIMAGLKTAATEDDGFAVVMASGNSLVMK
jgi:hypothetical protein